MTAAGAALAASTKISAAESRSQDLRSLATGAKPISAAEHVAGLAKVQSLMQQQRIAALLVENTALRPPTRPQSDAMLMMAPFACAVAAWPRGRAGTAPSN